MNEELRKVLTLCFKDLYQRIRWEQTLLSDGSNLLSVTSMTLSNLLNYFKGTLVNQELFLKLREIEFRTHQISQILDEKFQHKDELSYWIGLCGEAGETIFSAIQLGADEESDGFQEQLTKHLKKFLEAIERFSTSANSFFEISKKPAAPHQYVMKVLKIIHVAHEKIQAEKERKLKFQFEQDQFAKQHQLFIQQELDTVIENIKQGNVEALGSYLENYCSRPMDWENQLLEVIGEIGLIINAEPDIETNQIAVMKAERLKSEGMLSLIGTTDLIVKLGRLHEKVKEIELIGHWGTRSFEQQKKPIISAIQQLQQDINDGKFPHVSLITLRACKIAGSIMQSQTPPLGFIQNADLEIIDNAQKAYKKLPLKVPVSIEEWFLVGKPVPAVQIIVNHTSVQCSVITKAGITTTCLESKLIGRFKALAAAKTKFLDPASAAGIAVRSVMFACAPELTINDFFGDEQKTLIKKYHNKYSTLSLDEKATLKKFYAASLTFSGRVVNYEANLVEKFKKTLMERGSKALVKGYVQAVVPSSDLLSMRPYTEQGPNRPSNVGPKALRL